jgi:hypothetical protein
MYTSAGIHRGPVFIVVGSIVEIEVGDVEDPVIVAVIKRTVLDSVGHLAGKWRVHLAASGNFGQWDLRVAGAFGRHVARFRSTPERLADCVARRLRAFLHDVVPPLGVVRHPTLATRRVYPGPAAHQPARRSRPRLVRALRNAS